MAKCIGDCSRCELMDSGNWMACCAVQTLKNVIEVKALLRKMTGRPECVDAETPAADEPGVEELNF